MLKGNLSKKMLTFFCLIFLINERLMNEHAQTFSCTIQDFLSFDEDFSLNIGYGKNPLGNLNQFVFLLMVI